jgi:hypothetical protein
MEDKEGTQGDTGETDAVIPLIGVAKIGNREHREKP